MQSDLSCYLTTVLLHCEKRWDLLGTMLPTSFIMNQESITVWPNSFKMRWVSVLFYEFLVLYVSGFTTSEWTVDGLLRLSTCAVWPILLSNNCLITLWKKWDLLGTMLPTSFIMNQESITVWPNSFKMRWVSVLFYEFLVLYVSGFTTSEWTVDDLLRLSTRAVWPILLSDKCLITLW